MTHSTSAETNNALPYPAVLKQTTSTLYTTSWQQGPKRLQSDHPFSEQTKQLSKDARGKTHMGWVEETWETRWDITRCQLREFIQTPSNNPIGHDLSRHSLVRLDRIRPGYGRFKSNTNQTAQHRSPASVRYTVATKTRWCWTLHHATGFTTCSVSYRTPQSNARRRIMKHWASTIAILHKFKLRVYTSEQRTGCGSIPTSLDQTKQAMD